MSDKVRAQAKSGEVRRSQSATMVPHYSVDVATDYPGAMPDETKQFSCEHYTESNRFDLKTELQYVGILSLTSVCSL